MMGKTTRRVVGCAAGLALAAGMLGAAPAHAENTAILVGLEGNTLFIRGSDRAEDLFVMLDKENYLIVNFDKVVPNKVYINSRCQRDYANPRRTPGATDEIFVNCGKAGPIIDVDISLGGGDDKVLLGGVRGSIKGEAGNDRLGLLGHEDGRGNRLANAVAYSGGEGIDTISYNNADAGVNVTLGSGTGNDGRRNLDHDDIAGDVENIDGSRYDDNLFGSDANNVINAFSGADDIRGRGGDDVLRSDGHGGWVVMTSDTGQDKVTCGTGADEAFYDGSDVVDSSCERKTAK